MIQEFYNYKKFETIAVSYIYLSSESYFVNIFRAAAARFRSRFVEHISPT
jgi:hypothetical protein